MKLPDWIPQRIRDDIPLRKQALEKYKSYYSGKNDEFAEKIQLKMQEDIDYAANFADEIENNPDIFIEFYVVDKDLIVLDNQLLYPKRMKRFLQVHCPKDCELDTLWIGSTFDIIASIYRILRLREDKDNSIPRYRNYLEKYKECGGAV